MLNPPKNRWITAIVSMLLFLGLSSCTTGPKPTPSDPGTEAGNALIQLYRGPLNHLTSIRAGSCPMHPSCSEYSRQAIARHGLATGWLLTQDRLLRCGRLTPGEAPRIWIDNQLKWLDPLEDNTFWFNTQESRP